MCAALCQHRSCRYGFFVAVAFVPPVLTSLLAGPSEASWEARQLKRAARHARKAATDAQRERERATERAGARAHAAATYGERLFASQRTFAERQAFGGSNGGTTTTGASTGTTPFTTTTATTTTTTTTVASTTAAAVPGVCPLLAGVRFAAYSCQRDYVQAQLGLLDSHQCLPDNIALTNTSTGQ